jgi:hypothetical protein
MSPDRTYSAPSPTRCVGSHPNVGPDNLPDQQAGLLCLDCWSRLRSVILELPAIVTWLEVNIAAGQGALNDRVSGTSEDPMPLRADITDLIGPVAPDPYQAIKADAAHQLGDPSIFDELRSWAALVEEEAGFEWEDRQTITGAVTYLAGHLSWIAAQPWVDEFAAKVADLSRRAHRIAPWRAEARHDREPCVDCGVRAVLLLIGDGVMRCSPRLGGCGRRQAITEYMLSSELPKARRTA